MPRPGPLPRPRKPEVSELNLWACGDDEELFPFPRDLDPAERFFFPATEQEEREAWERVKEIVLKTWDKHRSGRRPRLWWKYEADSAEHPGETGEP